MRSLSEKNGIIPNYSLLDKKANIPHTIEFIINAAGDVICSQWNSDIEQILRAIGEELMPEMGHFCG